MTMCVFWKDVENNIHAATDSRLNNKITTLDHCLKLSRLQCNVYDAGEDELKKTVKLAVAFCGGFISSYTIKESLSEILDRVSLLPDSSSLSMSLIADVALSVYKRIVPDIIDYALSGDSACMFYLIGYCENDKEMQMYKIGCQANTNGIGYSFTKDKCFANKNYELDGSGASFVRNQGNTDAIVHRYLKKDSRYGMLDLLQSVIDDDGCKSVGGAIQYAKCMPEGPSIYSMLKDDNGEIKYLRGGVDLNEMINETLGYNVMIEAQMIVRG